MRLKDQDTINLEQGASRGPFDQIAEEAEACRTTSPTEMLLDFLFWEGVDAAPAEALQQAKFSAAIATQPAPADDRFDWLT